MVGEAMYGSEYHDYEDGENGKSSEEMLSEQFQSDLPGFQPDSELGRLATEVLADCRKAGMELNNFKEGLSAEPTAFDSIKEEELTESAESQIGPFTIVKAIHWLVSDGLKDYPVELRSGAYELVVRESCEEALDTVLEDTGYFYKTDEQKEVLQGLVLDINSLLTGEEGHFQNLLGPNPES